ncbi:MAG TPA: hypothetical protein VKB68_07315 [Stellaceae bacterium]|nr:hypothetical protein [Stellaceae bacterium]
MRKWIIALVVVVVAGAGGYYGWTRLHDYSGEQFRIGLDQWIKTLPPDYAMAYKTAEYDVATDTATLGSITVKGTGTTPFDLTVDQVEVSKPSKDFGEAWAQAAANPAQIAPDKALPVAGGITVKGVTLHIGSASSTMALANLQGLRVYPWALLHSGVPSFADVQATLTAKRADQPQLADVLPLIRFEAAVLLGIGYDAYAVEDMRVTATMPATPQMPATDITYTIRKFGGSGYDRGTRGDAQLEGAVIKAAPLGTVTVERASMAGLDVQKPLTQLLSGDNPTAEMLDGLKIGDIRYSGMKVQTPDGKDVPVGTLSISKIGFAKGVPVSGELSYAGLQLNKGLMSNPQARDAFEQLGIETVTLSLGFSYQWDLEQKRVALRNVALKVDELGALNLSADLADMTPGDGWQARGSFAHALLRYDDASLADRALKVFALQTNTDGTAVRQQIMAIIDMRAATLGNTPAIAAIADALKTFLGAPHSLTIELAPSAPVPFSTLQGAATMQPADIATLIGLKVDANK